VAALGNPITTALFALVFLAFAAGLGIIGWVLTHFDQTPLFGWLFAYLSFGNVFWSAVAAAGLAAAIVYVFTHFKWGYELLGDDWRKSLRTIHFNELWMRFYDYDLNPNVGYARHAISIDENRKNFERVPWYSTKETSRDEYGIQWTGISLSRARTPRGPGDGPGGIRCARRTAHAVRIALGAAYF
jgi:Uncharacterized alpha/beta hydrolase domain (DUF2235)